MRFSGTRRALFSSRTSFLDLTWNVDAAGNWSSPANWTGGKYYPNGIGHIARFLTAITANRIVTVDVPITIGSVFIGDDQNYTIAGSQVVTFNSSGTSVLTTTSTGTPTISAPVSLLNGFTATITPTTTISGVITGSPAFTKAGAGVLILSATNTFTGTIALNAGTLRAGSSSTNFGSLTAITTANISGAILDLNGFNVTIGSIAGGGSTGGGTSLGAGTLTLGGSNTSTSYAGVISGSGGVTKTGTGTTTLSAINTFTGAVTINVGTLQAGASTTCFGVNTAVTLANTSGVALDLNNFNVTIGVLSGGGGTGGNVTLGSGTLTCQSGTGTMSGIVSGTGGFTKTSANTQTLAGVNTYTGITTITGGTVSISADSGLGTAPGSPVTNQIAMGAGTLTMTATFTLNSNRGITLSAACTFTVSSGATVTYNGIIAGSFGITKISAGTLVLGGVNTYTGSTTNTTGTLQIAADSGLGTAPGGVTAASISMSSSVLQTTATFTLNSNRGITMTGASTISTNTSTILTYNGIITGAFALTKAGAGVLVLGGVNTYTGATSLTTGFLLVTGSTHSSSAVTVSSGAFLGGSGTINGSVTVSAGGAFSAGVDATPTTLTIGGGLTIATTTGWTVDTSGTTPDLIAVTGNLSLSGTITVNFPDALSGAATLTIATYTGTLTGGAGNLSIGTNSTGRTFVAFVAAAGIVTAQFS